jgi:6-phosphogluconate dehydrogenase
MLGLGRMGMNMARRLMRGGHDCVVYDIDPSRVSSLAAEGSRGAGSLEQFIALLNRRRIVWMMLPAGEPTRTVIERLGAMAEGGDIVIEGGNSHYADDVQHGAALGERGIEFVDCGTSGGVWGLDRGYCLMLGGARETVDYLDPILRTLAPGRGETAPGPHRGRISPTAESGYLYAGPHGAGHFAKMVHNGIEYGVMQAYAEGFDLLNAAGRFGYRFSLPDLAEVWRHGSVITSWLLDLAAAELARHPDLAPFEGAVADSGEGRWALQTAIDAGVACPALSAALYTRFRSRLEHTFAEKVLSAMRFGFGGHTEIADAAIAKVGFNGRGNDS